jgi:hypothetical protein
MNTSMGLLIRRTIVLATAARNRMAPDVGWRRLPGYFSLAGAQCASAA